MVTASHKKPASSSVGRAVFRAIPVASVVANSKKVSKKKTVPKDQRKNRKGWMDGLRAELVCPLIPAYVDALEISKAAGTLKMKEIQHLFHSHFPWPMEDWEEPPRPLNKYDPLAPLPSPPNLTEERMVIWSKHMNSINKVCSDSRLRGRAYLIQCQRLERWIKWRIEKPRRGGTGSEAFRVDPGDPILSMVRGLGGAKKRIRARSGPQQYLHDEYAVHPMVYILYSHVCKIPTRVRNAPTTWIPALRFALRL